MLARSRRAHLPSLTPISSPLWRALSADIEREASRYRSAQPGSSSDDPLQCSEPLPRRASELYVGSAGARRKHAAQREPVVEAEQEHTALVAAIADGDSQRAEACARRHIQAAQRNLLTHWVGA
ncbi:FCD domain-containing protein [Methylobacterium phyllosphaerae]